MLMPPQNPQNQTPAPSPSPAPQYDFIFGGGQEPKKGSGLPKVSGPRMRPALLVLFGVVGLIFIIILYSVFFGSKVSNTDELVKIMARAQEITRVSEFVDQQSKDSDTQGLALTTINTLKSDQTQLTAYLKTQKTKVSTKALAVYQDKNTDSKLLSASQTNTLSSFYFAYLKEQLAKYQDVLKTAFDHTPAKAEPILQDAYESAQTILTSSRISTTQ
jgi:hypothetical protein